MTPDLLLAGVLLASLIAYAVTGGADFGGGIWDLLATGPRAPQQRRVIAHAIGPIWEANHVWLILAVVVLFAGFPPAFAALSTDLHIPLAVLLGGIVLRGAAFAFRSYGGGTDRDLRLWSRVFAIASLVSPIMLGVIAGAVGSGRMRIVDGQVQTDFVSSWLARLPIATGLLTLLAFAWLAAVYLTLETQDQLLRADFRRRAQATAPAVAAVAVLTLWFVHQDAPLLWAGLAHRPWTPGLFGLTAALFLATVWAMARFWHRLARLTAAGAVALIVSGWGLALHPYVIPPDLTLTAAAAPDSVIVPVLWTLAAGSVLLAPAFVWLFAVFKARPGLPPADPDRT